MANITKPTGMSIIWAASGTKTPPTELKIAQGWVVELPPYQTANFIENKQDQFNGHTNMHGVPEWDGVTEYQGGVSYTKGSNGIIYKCVATNFNFDPTNPLNSNYWTKAFEDFGSVAVVANNLATLQNSYNTLSNLTSYPTARTNLSVFSKTESDARYAMVTGNATNVFSVAPATLGTHAIRLDQLSTLIVQATESTLGLVRLASAIQTETGADNTTAITPLRASSTFLKKSDNLASLASAATARTNLGLGTIAVEAATAFLRTSNNLSDLANATTARSNLGITSTATQPETYFLRSSLNLSDLVSASSARTNLGLGGAAVLNVGSTAGTVAAGNDTRIVNAVQTSRTLTAGNGLTGGGNLAADRTFTLGTPSSVSAVTGNTVFSTTHSHALDVPSFLGTTASTAAAGNDSRIVNATPNSRTLVAGNGLTGGGNLTADRTFTLGTPSTVSAATGNTVSSTTHSHDLDVASFLGTSAGTAAAGNDARIVNATPNSRVIEAGGGLTGGGDLTSNRTVTLGTPGTINVGTGNSVTSTSHTHAFDITSFFGDRSLSGSTGYYTLPGGCILQWGTVGALNDDQTQIITLPKTGVTIVSVQVTGFGSVNASVGPCFVTDSWTSSSFRVGNNYGTGAYASRWFAVTVV